MREWDKDKRTEDRDAERGDRGREVREVRMRERSSSGRDRPKATHPDRQQGKRCQEKTD